MTDIVGEPETDYQRVQNSEEFQALKRRFRRFVFPMTAFFLSWYFLYVLLADYAHDFMATKVWGNINVGLLLGLRPVRHHLRDHDDLRALGEQPAGPGGRRLRLHIEDGDRWTVVAHERRR